MFYKKEVGEKRMCRGVVQGAEEGKYRGDTKAKVRKGRWKEGNRKQKAGSPPPPRPRHFHYDDRGGIKS